MDWLFNRKTPQEILKQNQRALNKTQRDLDRERTKLETQEKKLINDIKKTAKAGQMNACKIMAKDLVRTRNYIHKFYLTKTQIQAIQLQLQTSSSSLQMTTAMINISKCLKSMNKSIKIPQMQKIMMDFERESGMMEMKQEMIEDTIDDVMEDNEEEEEEIVNQVLDEIGISLGQELQVPMGATTKIKEDDLQQRLDMLRKE